jgi:hypothetical protein
VSEHDQQRAFGLLLHEIQRPLATLNSNAEMTAAVARRTLMATVSDTEALAPALAQIAKQVDAMRAAQRPIATVIRIASLVARGEGEVRMRFERLSLGPLCLEAWSDVPKNIQLRHTDHGKLSRDPTSVVGDSQLLIAAIRAAIRCIDETVVSGTDGSFRPSMPITMSCGIEQQPEHVVVTIRAVTGVRSELPFASERPTLDNMLLHAVMRAHDGAATEIVTPFGFQLRLSSRLSVGVGPVRSRSPS